MSDGDQGPQRPRVPSKRPQAKRPQQQADGQPAPARRAQRPASPGQPTRKPQARQPEQTPAQGVRKRPATENASQESAPAQRKRPAAAAGQAPRRAPAAGVAPARQATPGPRKPRQAGGAPTMRPYGAAQNIPPFKSLRGLAIALTALFSVLMVASTLTTVMKVEAYGIINEILNEPQDENYRPPSPLKYYDDANFGKTVPSKANATAADKLLEESTLVSPELAIITGLVSSGAILAIIVLFIIWFYMAAGNTRHFRRVKPRWSTGWAIGGWFIPLAQFIIPFLVAQDIWKGSKLKNQHSSKLANASWAIPVWWFTFMGIVVGVWLFMVAYSFLLGADLARGNVDINSTLKTIIILQVIHAAGIVIATTCAILAVQAVTKRQQLCSEEVREERAQAEA